MGIKLFLKLHFIELEKSALEIVGTHAQYQFSANIFNTVKVLRNRF